MERAEFSLLWRAKTKCLPSPLQKEGARQQLGKGFGFLDEGSGIHKLAMSSFHLRVDLPILFSDSHPAAKVSMNKSRHNMCYRVNVILRNGYD